MSSSCGAHLDYIFLQSQHGHRCRNLDNAVCYLTWVDFYSCSWRVSISLISTGTNMLCCINLYRFFTIFTVRGMPTSSKSSPILYNFQYSNYSDSNTSWTPSEVPSGMSTTTSAIKISEVTFFFLAFGQTPPPPTLGSGSSSHHPLAQSIRHHENDDIILPHLEMCLIT